MLVMISILATLPAGYENDVKGVDENNTISVKLTPESSQLSPKMEQEEPFSGNNVVPSNSVEKVDFEVERTPETIDNNQAVPQFVIKGTIVDDYEESIEGKSPLPNMDDLLNPTDAPYEPKTFSNEFIEVPDVEDTESEFQYMVESSSESDLETVTVTIPDLQTRLAPNFHGPPEGDKGNKLGNAPEALYKVLQKFLAKGKMPPPNFPVPYVIYTNSSGVEKFTDALTKMPIMLNVDDNKDTGQGNGKDIRVRTTMSVNPLRITVFVELRGGTPPPDLQIYVSFPAFFYNGEAGDPDGEPYWLFGYETRDGSNVPDDITITFGVDQSLGSDHVFDFDWASDSGIDPLRFRFGTFQVVDQNTTNPIFPAFASFEVSSPPTAGLTFETIETDTMTQKCMYWTAPFSFNLSFNFSEIEELVGLDYDYPMTITVDQVPQSFSICTIEDRAANTYSIDYVASAPVDVVLMSTVIEVEGLPTVEIDLRIEDMPDELHVLMGDGYLNVDVTSNVGLLALDASADLGLAAIDSMINARLRIYDIPDFNATWFADDTGNGFALDAPSCVGSIELAFSFGGNNRNCTPHIGS
jgi:hypothetical protein